jgi:hypothetical protein
VIKPLPRDEGDRNLMESCRRRHVPASPESAAVGDFPGPTWETLIPVGIVVLPRDIKAAQRVEERLILASEVALPTGKTGWRKADVANSRFSVPLRILFVEVSQ